MTTVAWETPNLKTLLEETPQHMAKRLLYIAPYFPPIARASAYTTIKFVRALAAQGSVVDVLCDLWPSAPRDPGMLQHIPANVRVFRDFSPRAQGLDPLADPEPIAPQTAPHARARYTREWLPMGEMGFHIGHASRAAGKRAQENAYDAVIAHASPVAALEVGRRVASKTGLPLIGILDDPWGPCELRRPSRPWHTRAIEGWFERLFLKQARHCFLVTEAARDAYIAAFPNVPATKFSNIHCGIDAPLLGPAPHTPDNAGRPFTLLFLGTFSRFITIEQFFPLLSEMRRRGWTADKLRFQPTAWPDRTAWAEAARLGIQDFIRPIPPVPHTQVAAIMAAADVLVVSAPTPQRIQAKIYDYLTADRPILALTEAHPELRQILETSGAGKLFRPTDATSSADYLEALMKTPHPPRAPHDPDVLRRLTTTVSADAILRKIV